MKLSKIIYIMLAGLIFHACSLEEEPPFLAQETVYNSGANAKRALDGAYETMRRLDYFGQQYPLFVNMGSGFMVTRKGGNNNTNINNTSVASLKPLSNSDYLTGPWAAIYKTIGVTNDGIGNMIPISDPQKEDELLYNDVLGQMHFVRAFNYFQLVTFWGDVPLRLNTTTMETLNMAKTPAREVYAQIIKDAEQAADLMNGTTGVGYPKANAANMLLAKVYMALATAPESIKESGVNYWQLAYDEAIKAYGNYQLVPTYSDLFTDGKSDNTNESIFEIQSAIGASLDWYRVFTPSQFLAGGIGYGYLKINAEVYDLQNEKYPNDPRIGATYLSYYTTTTGGSTTTYPTRANRATANFNNAFPYFVKFAAKDPSHSSSETNQNYIVYRYADLLLMLAEISNELENGEQLGYVTEVLGRVGLAPQAGYSGGKEAFRLAVMQEYTFELLGEGHDWFNNRRRGYQFFLDNVILPHNNYSKFNAAADVTFETDEATVMFAPIPSTEINTNQLINE